MKLVGMRLDHHVATGIWTILVITSCIISKTPVFLLLLVPFALIYATRLER